MQVELVNKWKPLLESEQLPAISNPYRKWVTARLLENQMTDNMRSNSRGLLQEAGEVPSNTSTDLGGVNANNTTNISGYDSVMINLVRRSAPNMIAYDICGVQPMAQPNTLIFAMRSRFINPAPDSDLRDNTEAFFNEAPSAYSGTGTQVGNSPSVLNSAGSYTRGVGQATIDGELLGTANGAAFKEMGFTIEKISVTAKTRALKAQYTTELAHDLKQVHGLDAETELSNILSQEIMAEQNREVVRTVYLIAKPGSQNTDLTAPGFFDLDLDSNGRWAVEKFKGMLFQIEREANQIAKETRRGRGNIIVCSSDVASALAMAGVLDYAPALSTGLEVDDTGNTFAGILQGRYKVYIDPYAVASSPTPEADAAFNFFVVGYRGANQYDAGLFYCPYVPLQMYQVIDSNSFQPKIGFKTRYGMVANPFAHGINQGLGALTPNQNVYYRRTVVKNLTGSAAGV